MSCKEIFLLFFTILSLSSFQFLDTAKIEAHSIYIGIIKINHSPAAPTATIQMRVFSDDLKSALRNAYGYESISEKETFCEDYESYFNRYFNKNFTCTINKENVRYYLSNCNREETVFLLEFTMDCPEEWDLVQIQASFFMELFPRQSNIVHLEQGQTKRFGRATKGKEILNLRF